MSLVTLINLIAIIEFKSKSYKIGFSFQFPIKQSTRCTTATLYMMKPVSLRLSIKRQL